MPKAENKEEIKNSLKNTFECHKNKGLISVYLWGSILTDDFDSKTSDVDIIVFVGDGVPPEEENELRNLFSTNTPNVTSLGLRFVYLNEFDDGISRGSLTKYIDPKLLLHDFKYWAFIAGKKFTYEDFKLEDISEKEAVRLKLEEISGRYISVVEDDFIEHKYFLKALSRLIYYLQQEDRGKTWPFSYSSLKTNSSKEDEEVINLLLELRRKNWDRELFKSKKQIYLNFLEKIRIKNKN